MFSSIRSVCLCHVFADLATFETQLDILLFFNSSLTLSLGFPCLCSVSDLYHLAGPGVFDEEEPSG
uniref:Uncharacterized protein n=1 Tax=Phaseolus vulgaris TaxID=3885 RepID=V7ANZ1_PHAVU|nr:hypothetical protein PHAVU_010G117300g [Phaseolus vulgaris]ESW07289.1 hypothetical protein PHAVU_010G117300g [Phaseolus vulgaris]